ncbi:HypC/HybG/HupF family hydrogenase formation chaperone [Cyanobium sp. FGCU-52]|nr:HypC/HybG/HupF family hydrogenase formation chaperone [Cyanobium sp. FGCU52]
MCLAVSGRILSITQAITQAVPTGGEGPGPGGGPGDDPLWRQAEVDFGGVRQTVSLACLPEARVGDRVLVHVGLALSLVEDDS